jgi:hypothetical protein
MKKVLVIILLAGLFTGCKYDNGVDVDPGKCFACNDMPTGATDIEIIDLKWAKFTLDGERFLIFVDNSQAAITKISE